MGFQLVNGTSHSISIYSADDCVSIQNGRKLVLKDGAQPVAVVPAGQNLNAQTTNLASPSIAGCDLPLVGAVTFTGHDPIPDGDIVVVSQMFRAAVAQLGGDTSRLATVSGTVYSDDTAVRPCGCTALAVG